jgi:hypothetical protein
LLIAWHFRDLEDEQSTIAWQSISVEPPVDVSLLVRMDLAGPTYDVAIFVGTQPNGERRWILADICLNQRLVTHWAPIHEPSGIEDG